MDVPNNIKEVISKLRKGLRQHTFVFSLHDVKLGDANDTVNAFCETHDVLSIVFSESKGNLVYVIIYKV